jgi:hypothetical protein
MTRADLASRPGRSSPDDPQRDEPLLAHQFAGQHRRPAGGCRCCRRRAPGRTSCRGTAPDRPAGRRAPPRRRPRPPSSRRCSRGHGPLEIGSSDQQHVVDQGSGDGDRGWSPTLDRDALGDGLAAAFRRSGRAFGGELGNMAGSHAEDADVRLHRLGRRGHSRRSARRRRWAPAGFPDPARPPATPARSVPWPATTSRRRTAETKVKPRSSRSGGLVGRRASVKSRPLMTTVAPWARVPSDLHEGRPLGHHDGHGHAEPGAVIGQALGVVAGAGGDHAALAFIASAAAACSARRAPCRRR